MAIDFRLRKEEKDLSDVGRRRIDDMARRNVSKRALMGSLTVLRKNFICKRCGHTKAFRNTMYTKNIREFFIVPSVANWVNCSS